jgi:two-component system, NarL family, nitrate/nitrite response regulator NarL
MRLLLCDDHRLFAESLALVLSEAGYQVVAVTHSFEETCAALRREPVDVCVLSHAPGPLLDHVAKVYAAAPDTEIVLLARHAHTSAGDPVLAAAAKRGARALVYSGQSIAAIIEAIERVGGGAGSAARVEGREPGTAAPARGGARGTRLTAREREVLGHLVRGNDTSAIAAATGVRPATARSHIQSVLMKLGVHTRIEAAATAVRHGLVDPETGDWLRN